MKRFTLVVLPGAVANQTTVLFSFAAAVRALAVIVLTWLTFRRAQAC
jgi:hypothetical protein